MEKKTYSEKYLWPLLNKLLLKTKKEGFLKNRLAFLDVGCKNGDFCNFISCLGFDAVGLDIASEAVNYARKTFPGAVFYHTSIYDFKEADLYGTFDVVTAVETIEHLQYPRLLLRQSKLYLKPDGYLIISTPYHGYLKNLVMSILNYWDKHCSVGNDAGHLKFFSVRSLAKILKEEGFTNIRFYFAGGLPYLRYSMICACQAASNN